MSRSIDPEKNLGKSTDELRAMLSGASDDERQYLRERPWMLAEYERQGLTDEVQAIRDGSTAPEVDPNEAGRVSTENMRQGVIPVERRPQPNGVQPQQDEDDQADAYETWSKEDLVAEVEFRNEGRPDDQKMSKSGTKQELVDRLYADDEASSNDNG